MEPMSDITSIDSIILTLPLTVRIISAFMLAIGCVGSLALLRAFGLAQPVGPVTPRVRVYRGQRAGR